MVTMLFTLKLIRKCIAAASEHGIRLQQDIPNFKRRFSSQATVGSICKTLTKKLRQKKVPEAKISTNLMVAHVLGRTTLHGVPSSTLLSESQVNQLEIMCAKRINRMPVQYIIGEWDFCDLTLKVEPPTLIPRPETEELANFVISYIKGFHQTHFKVMDIGSGSGALILAILHSLSFTSGVAVDVAEHACRLTMENAVTAGVENRLKVIKLDITKDISDLIHMSPFDLIVSNPPYLTDKCLQDIEAELRYEDNKALYGGPDGLDIVKSILSLAPQLLKPNGSLWLELGLGQCLKVKNLVQKDTAYKLKYIETLKDFTDRDRFCHLEYKNGANT